MTKKKKDPVEPRYNYSIAIPVPSAYKRKQVYDAVRWFDNCEISSPNDETLQIKFFGLTESDCNLRRAVLLTQIKHRRGTLRNWEYERTPVELDESTRKAHGKPQEDIAQQ